MSSHKRLVVLSFDELSIDQRIPYDSTVEVEEDDHPAAAPTPPVLAGQGLDRQALAYVAGYVAAKCLAIDPILGQVTSEPSAEPRDERHAWILALSRGDLVVPSSQWLREVEELEVVFFAMHDRDIVRGPGVVRRLANDAVEKFPDRDPRVLKKYAMTRTQLRISEPQRAFAEKLASRAAEKNHRTTKRARTEEPERRPAETSHRAAKRARY